jgi:hypothetical protein
MRVELRAIFAAVAACALVFSLLVSGAANAGRMLTHNAVGAATAGCPHDRDASIVGTASSKPSGGQTEHIHCPDCRLVTQAGSAVLPERLATMARPAPAAAHAAYSAFASLEPIAAVSNTANGARAPPA